MKPIIHEQDGVRVAVAVQVINKPVCCGGAHGSAEYDRESRAARRAEQLEMASDLVRFCIVQCIYIMGALFACGVWMLGRIGDGLRGMEQSMGGSRGQLVPAMLPVWMRPPDKPAPKTVQPTTYAQLTTGDEREILDDRRMATRNRAEQSRQRVARRS